MELWRIAREAHAALDGEGARLYGARWTPRGTPAVYASSHLSLAALEYLVHIDAEDAPDDLVALRISVPDDVAEVAVSRSTLPADWRQTPPPPECETDGGYSARDGTPISSRNCDGSFGYP